MVEYILGIGHLNMEECEQVFNEVSKRKEELTKASATITREINVLNTIQFQVSQRKTEIQNKTKEWKRVVCDKHHFDGVTASGKCLKCENENI